MKRYRKSASGGARSGHSLPGDFGAAVAGLVVRYCRKDSLKQRGNGLGCDVAADERPSDLVAITRSRCLSTNTYWPPLPFAKKTLLASASRRARPSAGPTRGIRSPATPPVRYCTQWCSRRPTSPRRAAYRATVRSSPLAMQPVQGRAQTASSRRPDTRNVSSKTFWMSSG